ncbi:MAG: DUF547 domain-containing protein [Halofilum sp. (in: g-proteobacteria)]|nr:DUF547 domain-containing protein [Halofilum sp. (in: g-proteobacteria)]
MKPRWHVITVLLLGAVAAMARAAPEADPWPRWQAHDPDAAASIDHGAWTRWLERHRRPGPDGVARVDYGGVSTGDRERLQGYIDRLAGVAISGYRRPEQLAFWINLYNASTVEVVLEHYPVDSIRDIDISPGWFSNGPWGRELVEVEGIALSLDDIEHRILRPIWDDPRIHYAVNCAAIGCPDLQPVAFTADNAERLLERGARAYVNDPRGAAIVDGELVVSSIYHWFRADFGDSARGVVAHLRRYAGDDLAARLAGRDGYDDHRYDWTLNDVP